MIPISKVRTSASKEINLMALIRTLTISTTTFERMKEKFYGFRQTVFEKKYDILRLLFVLATEYTVLEMFLNICHRILFPGGLHDAAL